MVWKWSWLTPLRCRALLALVLLAGMAEQVWYLHHCPIDLSGDEAHYWDWSRQLDWSYYSKGPAVAYIIRASCAIFGDTMPAVRYPAVLLAAMTSIVMYALTFRMFRSDRLALGVVLLSAMVPMFIAGSLLMTIDPPMFFCWGLGTYLFYLAVFEQKKWAWPAAGLAIGIGVLAKYALLIWLPAGLLFLVIDRASRRLLKTAGPWVMVVVALACMTPVLVWNSQHGWVTFKHVARQTGMAAVNEESDEPKLGVAERVGEFVGAQAGVVGPVAVFMIGGLVTAVKRRHRRVRFLAVIGGVFWLVTFADAFRSKVQVNWPAPAYFTLVILAGYIIARCMGNELAWRRWRGWVYATIVFGLVLQGVTRDFSILYPLARARPTMVDPTVKLRGWATLGQQLGKELATMRDGSFILCDDYQQTAETAFYTPGQPKTYYAGSYFEDAKRLSQYDLWPDRSLDPKQNPTLLGRNAIYVGYLKPELSEAFERVEELPPLDIERRGVKIRTFRVSRCYNFKGISRPEAKKY